MGKKFKWSNVAAVMIAAGFVVTAAGCQKTEQAANAVESNQLAKIGQGAEDRVGTGENLEKDSVTVVLNTESEPKAGFDPVFGWGAGEHVHEPLIQSTLMVTTRDMGIGYDLAKSMEASEDAMTWTVKIRDDVFFTDGEKLTAGDVAFTYNTVKEKSTVSDFTMLDRAEEVDDSTVVFHMKRPYSIWPYTMAVVGIFPEHAYGAGYGTNPIGSGRYILKQWDRGQQVIFEANPNYYGEAPLMKKVTILFMEEDAAFAAVKAGQADLAYTAASFADQGVGGYELLPVRTVDNRGFNLPSVQSGIREDGKAAGNDFTFDVRVRQAINLGINRDEMIENVLNGYGTKAYSICDQMPWYQEAMKTEYDPGKAADLLDEAGWILGEDGIRQKDGISAKLTFWYPAGDSVRQALAADTAVQLRELGIDANEAGTGWDEAYDHAFTEPLMWGWGAHSPMELYNVYHTDESGKNARYSPYSNEKVDTYMDQSLASSDLEASYELWKKAQWDGEGGIAEDVPWVWLVNVDHLFWVRNGLTVAQQKLHPHGHGWSIVNNVDQWNWDIKISDNN